MNQNILDKVSEIVAKAHDIDRDTITQETHFFNDFTDSLEYIEIIMTCEEVFEIRISQEDFTLHRLETVARLSDFIQERLSQ